MSILDLMLNLAALLLWLNWRAVRLTAATQPSVLSLASALKRAEPRPASRWVYLAALIALLTVRAFVYWQLGPSIQWTPAIPLGVISLHFRSDLLDRMALYSILSFGALLWLFYFWLLLLALINRGVPDGEPLQRIVRLQLGRAARWSVGVQLMLPPVVASVVWLLVHRWFASLGLAAAAGSFWTLVQQSIVLGIGTFVSCKYLIFALLAAYVLNNYVYLGNSPLWNFVNTTGRNVLRTIRWLPLGIGKADFSPVVAILAVWLVAHYGLAGLAWLYQHPPL